MNVLNGHERSEWPLFSPPKDSHCSSFERSFAPGAFTNTPFFKEWCACAPDAKKGGSEATEELFA